MGLKGGRVLGGEAAPEFSLLNQNNERVELKQLLGNQALLIVFYPGDFTPVCTKQLCSYRDSLRDFKALGVNIVGISKNSPEEHAEFAKKYHFEFDLLSDQNREIQRRYGATSLFLLGGGTRAVYVISKNGRIIYRYIEPTPITHRKAKDLLLVLEDLKNNKII